MDFKEFLKYEKNKYSYFEHMNVVNDSSECKGKMLVEELKNDKVVKNEDLTNADKLDNTYMGQRNIFFELGL